MGNCLSCCEEPGTNDDHYAQRNDRTSNEQRHVASSGETSVANGNSTLASSRGTSSTERRMFYARIPPILTGGGDTKRSSQAKELSEAKMNAFFEVYKDAGEDAILAEGIEKFCQDLEVKPEEFKVLLLAWKFGAATMCRFTREEFLNGCRTLKAENIKGIQSKFPDMLKEAEDPEKFKDLYRFTFKFGLDAEIAQKNLPTAMAIGLWTLVFTQWEPPVLKRWIGYLELNPNIRGISKDTWNMFLNFVETVGDDLSAYDDTEAWPSLFDDFVEYENDQTNQNVQKKDDTD